MSANKIIVGLYQNHVSDLSETMRFLLAHGLDLVAAPIVHPMFSRDFVNESRHMVFSRSDLLLESHDWMYKFVSKISANIDCDSDDLTLRKHSEATLIQELALADHLIQHGFVMMPLKGTKTINLARTLSRNIKGKKC